MTAMFGSSEKISFGSANSPCRSPAESKKGAWRWSVSALAAAFLRPAAGAAFFRVLVSAIRRGPRKIEDFLGSSDLPRVGLAGRALDLDRLAGLPDEHQRALRSGHAALEEQQVSLGVDADDLVGPRGHALVAHLPRHAHTLEHPGGVSGTDRARLPDVHGAVAFRS